jgi:hypothetical protein
MEIKEVLTVLRETKSTSNSNSIAKQKLARRRDGKGCQTGIGAMLKTVYAIAVAAIVAACFVLLPSLSPQVDAAVPAANGKSDRADTRLLAKDCSQSAWPYYEASCLRDSRNTFGQAREVRFVPMASMQRAVASR